MNQAIITGAKPGTLTGPKHIISLGAGVQSSTMSLMAALGEITPMPIAAIFADTQAEPASVYKWLDWLENQLPFPVHRVTKGDLTADSLRMRMRMRTKYEGAAYTKTNIPTYIKNPDGTRGIVQRQCTYDYKLLPILKKQRELGEIKRGQKTVGVVSWIGISRDEIRRMKDSREPWAENRYPLVELEMTRSKCLDWMKQHGFPEPPRSACIYCPYHGNREWERMKNDEPLEFQRAVKFEKDLQSQKAKTDNMRGIPFLHNTLVPLGEIDFRDKDVINGQKSLFSLFDNECEGMCGV